GGWVSAESEVKCKGGSVGRLGAGLGTICGAAASMGRAFAALSSAFSGKGSTDLARFFALISPSGESVCVLRGPEQIARQLFCDTEGWAAKMPLNGGGGQSVEKPGSVLTQTTYL